MDGQHQCLLTEALAPDTSVLGFPNTPTQRFRIQQSPTANYSTAGNRQQGQKPHNRQSSTSNHAKVEWRDITITKVFPSILRNAVVIVRNDTTPTKQTASHEYCDKMNARDVSMAYACVSLLSGCFMDTYQGASVQGGAGGSHR